MNVAGCGSMLKDYPHLAAENAALSKSADFSSEMANRFSSKVKDISEFLLELGPRPPEGAIPLTATYHDACHLAHAQKERIAPRELLSGIPNLTLLEPPEWELCCGSAGTYNIDQPDLANQLGERKARNLLSTQPEAIVTGNIGCMTQIRKHLNLLGQDMPIYHTMELLDAAYRNIASP